MRKTLILLVAILGLLPALAAQAQDAQPTQGYVVQKGDTIGAIAQRFYGKRGLGASLWRANRNLVAHPNALTPGDTIFIFPESTLALNKAVEMPPESPIPPASLYDRGNLLEQSFPKQLSYLTNVEGRIPDRIRIKRLDPKTGELVDQYFEARLVGDIIASTKRGHTIERDGRSALQEGRTMLSTWDQVIVRFTEDVAKILDSDTYDDPDPYFRDFHVYSIGPEVYSPDRGRADYLDEMGTILQFKGTVRIDARFEGRDPAPADVVDRTKRRKRGGPGGDIDPVTYHAFINYCEDPIKISDKLVVFVPLDPGPERRLDPPFVEPPDTFVSPGK
jgi:hypothetical protein